jgi:two-component system phosphate regulon sensor histidine kinase PhoR
LKLWVRRGIVTDLVVLIAATLLPLLLLSTYLASRNISETRAVAATAARQQARETAARADALVGETQALLIGLAQTPTLREADPVAVRALLREVKVRYPYLDDLLAVDARGTIYVSAARPSDAAIAPIGQQFNGVLPSEGLNATSRIVLSQATARPVVLIAQPVTAGPGGSGTIGGVVAALDLLLLQQWLDDRSIPPGTTITVVDQRGGHVLARTRDPEAWVGRAVGDVPLVATAIRQREGVVEGPGLDEGIGLSAFTTAERVPWAVLVGIPRAAIDEPVRRNLRLMAFRLSLAIVGVVAMAVVGSRRIVGPLRRLTGGALVIARGDLDHRLAVERRDEVGRVAGAVNRMADELVGSIAALRETQARLEGAVAQVGRALTSSTEVPDLFARLVEAACALTRSGAGVLIVRGAASPIVWGEPLPEATLRALLASPDAGTSPDWPGALQCPDDASELCGDGLREHLVARVQARGRVLGALHVFRRKTRPYGADDTRLLRAFADQAAVAIEQDRLRREAAEAAALRRLHQLQSQFLTTAAHELRAPVAGIKSYAELLLRSDLPLDEGTRRDCLASIDRLADRLGAQVRAFFDAMRAEAGQLSFERQPLDLADLARAVTRDFAARSPEHTIVLDAGDDLPLALADRARVEDVLTNLLDNAVKYSPAGGVIAVELSGEASEREGAGAMVRVAVRDSGIGIPPDQQPRIFERFYRLDHTTTRKDGGIGLGLYLCRAYVVGMGGAIAVESQPGRGSSVTFTLPAVAEAPARPTPGAIAE